MEEDHRKLATVMLGVVSIIAVVGLVMMFNKAGTTGQYVMGSEFVQFNPYEVCEQYVGCPLKSVEGGIYYSSKGPLVAVCDCPSGEVRAPLVRPFDWREEYYPTE